MNSFITNINSNSSLYVLDNRPNRMFMCFYKKEAYICAHARGVCVCIHSYILAFYSFATFWTIPADQQSFQLAVVNLNTCKSCMNQLNLWHFAFTSVLAPAPALLSVVQHYEVQCITAPLQKLTASLWVVLRSFEIGRAHTYTEKSSHRQGKRSQYNPIPVLITVIGRSQVINLVILIRPTTPICYAFGHFYLSLSS